MERSIDEIAVLAAKICKHHGEPMRPGQRNCRECNRLANKKYRDSLKGPLDFARAMRKTRQEIAFKRPGFVYFIQADPTDEIKIGFSVDPSRRLDTLQTAAARELHLLATLPGTLELEREFHERFAAHRTIGEWFKASAEILDFIHSLRRPHTGLKIAC